MFESADTAIADLVARVAALEAAAGVVVEPPVDPPTDPPPEPTPNWQSALLNARAGDVIVIPAGTFTLTQGYLQYEGADIYCNFPVESGVTVKGQGIGKTILVGAGTTSCSPFGSIGGSNVAFSDMSIRTERYGATSQDGIKLEGCNGVTIRNVDFQNLYIGTNCIGSQNVRYEDCSASRCKHGFSVCDNGDWQGTSGVVYQGCVSKSGFWCYRWNTNTARPRDVTYSGCVATAVEEGSGFVVMNSDAVTLDTCTANDNPSAGIYLSDVKGYVLKSCTATGNARVDTSMENIRILNSTGTLS